MMRGLFRRDGGRRHAQMECCGRREGREGVPISRIARTGKRGRREGGREGGREEGRTQHPLHGTRPSARSCLGA